MALLTLTVKVDTDPTLTDPHEFGEFMVAAYEGEQDAGLDAADVEFVAAAWQGLVKAGLTRGPDRRKLDDRELDDVSDRLADRFGLDPEDVQVDYGRSTVVVPGDLLARLLDGPPQ